MMMFSPQMNLSPGCDPPPPHLSQVSTDWLPPARIRCNKGRIRVGDRNFLSASEALSAYLKQFDEKQQQQHDSDPGLGKSNISLDTSLYSGTVGGRSSVSCGELRPENVTSVLTGKLTSAGLGSSIHIPLNGEFLPQLDSKQSFRLGVPDYLGSSSHYGLTEPDLYPSRDDGKSHPAMNGYGSYNSPHPFLSSSLKLYNPHFGTSNGPQQHWPTISHKDYDSSPIQPVPLNGSSRLNGLTNTGHDNGVMDYLDFHCSPSVLTPGAPHNQAGTELLITAMPSQRQLKTLAEDALREAKMKRLLKEKKPDSLPSDQTGSAREARSRIRSGSAGERSKKDVSNERNRKLKSSLKETDEEKKQPSATEEKSALQLEVDEALSRSAQLLEDLKTTGLRKPSMACNVNSHHSADILLSSTNLADPTTHPSSSRPSRSRHRYSYHNQATRARSLSTDDGERASQDARDARTVANTQRCRSVDCVRSPFTGKSDDTILDLKRHRSLDNLMSSASGLRNTEEMMYLKKGTSVMSDCEDILRQLQAVNPPSLPPSPPPSRKMFRTKSTTNNQADSFCLDLEMPSLTPAPTGLNWKGVGGSADLMFPERDGVGTTAVSIFNPNTFNTRVDNLPGAYALDKSRDGVFGAYAPNKQTYGAYALNTSADGVPGTYTLNGSIDARIDDSSIVDLSYVGPGLNYSDLIITPSNTHITTTTTTTFSMNGVGTTTSLANLLTTSHPASSVTITTTPTASKHRSSMNSQADRPPKPPHRAPRSSNGKSVSTDNTRSSNGVGQNRSRNTLSPTISGSAVSCSNASRSAVACSTTFSNPILSSATGVRSAFCNPSSSCRTSTIPNPIISNPAISNLIISSPAISNPIISSPTISNSAISSPAVSNPIISSPAISNPAISNRNVSCPTVARSTVSSPTLQHLGDVLSTIGLNPVSSADSPQEVLCLSLDSAANRVALKGPGGDVAGERQNSAVSLVTSAQDVDGLEGEVSSLLHGQERSGHSKSWSTPTMNAQGQRNIDPDLDLPSPQDGDTSPVESVVFTFDPANMTERLRVGNDDEVPLDNEKTSELIPALKDYKFDMEPGGQSLEKALVHLGRLKTLVQTSPVKQTTPAVTSPAAAYSRHASSSTTSSLSQPSYTM